MRNFRLLTADEIECRISQVSEKGVGLLLYKTARTDYALLDEKFGMFGWQNDYRLIDGKMYCGIAVKNAETGEWCWKWNVGTESNTEAEKGQASDAMKRAGFCWGIGTELYSAPFIWIPYELLQRTNGSKVYDRFYVKSIGYDSNENISELQIVNDIGAVVFTHPRKKTVSTKADNSEERSVTTSEPRKVNIPAELTKASVKPNFCIECGAEVPDKVFDFSMKRWGKCYCYTCQKKYAGK